MNFSEKIRTARLAKQWSQKNLAEKSGISLRTIQNYELGTRLPKKQETYALLAAVLDIEESSLLDENISFVLRANERYGSNAMKQALDLVADVRALWAGGEMAEEDMDEIMRAMQEAYWQAKENNRRRQKENGNEKAS